jgi:two-component system nitrate/nitrite sensor histidine kinase NarX
MDGAGRPCWHCPGIGGIPFPLGAKPSRTRGVTNLIRNLAHKPIMVRLGVLMAAIVVLAVVSMLTSVIIAKTMEGMATAINQAGSLRMQSYRIGVALADDSLPPAERAARAEALAQEFEDRLRSPRLRNAIPDQSGNPVTMAHARVARQWREDMRTPLREHIGLLAEGVQAGVPALPRARYLAAVDEFVGEIDTLVRELEEVAEGRVTALRMIQWIALGLTVFAVLVAMTLVIRRVILPLQDLLCCADQARRGDFSGRTRYTGDDELGRLGAALNLMAEGLSQIYGALEQRVQEKTHDLARSNHSLDLLYRTSKVLNEAPVTDQVLRRVLADIQSALGTGPATLCLTDLDPSAAQPQCQARLLVSTRPPDEHGGPYLAEGCSACRDPQTVHRLLVAQGTPAERCILSLPVRDRDRAFGVLLIDLAADCVTEPWQEQLLGILAGHIGTAVNLQQRTREGRRLVLHEERTIIARELHDSLAQSLSYLKIQVARLAMALRDTDNGAGALAVLEELREGISSAYRQLRELLTTFRLKVDERGLSRALEDTVQEFRERGALDIRLANALPASLLSPNEEIHVLQIVREALSNVTRHARASQARVDLELCGGQVRLIIEDDGQGMAGHPAAAHHYGMTIMRERALSLDGALVVDSSPGGGTRILVAFQPRPGAAPRPVEIAPAPSPQETLH